MSPRWILVHLIADTHFYQLIGVWITPNDAPFRFRHINMFVYALPEGILIIFSFSRFPMYFGRKFFRNHVSLGIRAFVITVIRYIFEKFPTKLHEKIEKNWKLSKFLRVSYRQSYLCAGNARTHHLEWSRPRLIGKNVCRQLNEPKSIEETYYGRISMIIGQKTMGSLIFSVYLMTLPVHRITNT